MTVLPGSIDAVEALLEGQGYVGSRALATVVFLGLRLGKPLFLEGEAGVGKTEIAKVLAAGLGRKLIRLQCHEGLDAAAAVSEWNFAAQMIAIRAGEAAGRAGVFSEEFLIERPLLAAMRPQPGGAPILPGPHRDGDHRDGYAIFCELPEGDGHTCLSGETDGDKVCARADDCHVPAEVGAQSE